MKKIVLLLLVCFCLLTAGCSYGEVGLVQNSNGAIKEYYYIPIPEKELLTMGVTQGQIEDIIVDIRDECNSTIFDSLINSYQQAVSKTTYSFEQKAKLINGVGYSCKLETDANNNLYTAIKYEINFANSTCFQIFKKVNSYTAEDKVTETKNYLFTTVTKVVKDPIFDKIANDALTTGKIAINKAEQIMVDNLGDDVWNNIKTELKYDKFLNKFNYFYVVPTKRIHTNADSVAKDDDGYYHHKWTVNLNNLKEDGDSIIKIEYWTVSANRAVWYIVALIISGVIITTVYFVAKNKEKQNKEKFKIEQ